MTSISPLPLPLLSSSWRWVSSPGGGFPLLVVGVVSSPGRWVSSFLGSVLSGFPVLVSGPVRWVSSSWTWVSSPGSEW